MSCPTWCAVISALEDNEHFRSRVSVYLHPLGGRPILWHVARAVRGVTPPPDQLRILHHANVPVSIGDERGVIFDAVEPGDESRSLRAAITSPGMKVLVDGAAPLLTATTIARLLRAGEAGVTSLAVPHEHAPRVAVAGEGPALASADDPRRPIAASIVPPNEPVELLRVVDRHTLSLASTTLRDRLVQHHESRGVTFLLPATTWLDVDVRIGPDTMIYPGAVLEGATEIGSECVIGPHSRIVESSIGRGVELKGWNYVARASVRNHAVLEPYERRGLD
jgi:bifunctional N-acetylglucosamine-1-phosphate-uridyltransferase/glucosamine-1-phosphate-acetyltransferase GlmU-like protein